jgi:hypothetical protein
MASRWIQKMVKGFIFAIVFLGIFAAGFGSAVLHLWNWLMPALFGLHTITYWQALGLLGLSWLLLQGPRGWIGGHRYRHHRMGERWQQMTPEEREKFRTGMRAQCGHREPTPEVKA